MTSVDPHADTLELLRMAGSHPIVQGFPDGAIIVFDRDLRYLCAGGRGIAPLGLTQERIEGRTIYDIFPSEMVAEFEGPYRHALAGHETSLEVRFEDRIFLHRISPLMDAGGTVIAGIGYALDVTESRRSEEALRSSEQGLREERRRLRDAEAIGHSGSWEWDMATDTITWSEGLFALHHLDPTDFPGGYAQASARVHPDDRDLVETTLEACRTSEAPIRFRYRVNRVSDGEVRWFDSHVRGVFEDGALMRLVGAVADITDQVSAEAEADEANAFQQAVIAASPDYTFIADIRTGATIYGSRERDVPGLSGGADGSVSSFITDTVVHTDDQARLRAMDEQAVALGDGEVLEERYRIGDGEDGWRWLSRRIVPFRRDQAGWVTEVLGVLRDVTDVVEAEEKLSHDAFHDSLTGLPNRALLLDRLTEALSRSESLGREIGVLYLDLDGFKRVNDTAGHAAGDAVLIETANRLRKVVRQGDTVARVGGDEFVLVIEPWNRADVAPPLDDAPDTTFDRTLALKVADRVVGVLQAPIVVHGVEHRVTASVGITYPSALALDHPGTMTATHVVEEADAAMYWAKQEGKNRVEVFAWT